MDIPATVVDLYTGQGHPYGGVRGYIRQPKVTHSGQQRHNAASATFFTRVSNYAASCIAPRVTDVMRVLRDRI